MVLFLFLIVIVILIVISSSSSSADWGVVFLACVVILHRFGVTVGTHAIYDILVGWIAAGQ